MKILEQVTDATTGETTTREIEMEGVMTEAEAVAADHAKAAAKARAERNERLSDSDWSMLPDVGVDSRDWMEYRKALRDVPSQAGFPDAIEWPTAPGA